MASSNSHVVRAVAIELDVTADGTTIDASVKKAWDAFGHIDALINNACVRVNLSEEEWKSAISTNLKGFWLVSQYIGRQMLATKIGGSNINISSISGLNRALFMRGGIDYSSSKDAMDSMTKIMTLELGEHNIRVNAIAPGLFKLDITEKLVQKDWLKNVATTVPLKTLGTSDPGFVVLNLMELTEFRTVSELNISDSPDILKNYLSSFTETDTKTVGSEFPSLGSLGAESYFQLNDTELIILN
ncbi:hypothetical protein BC332_26068 [Capsicum chinense]|nr:hypothetical protein BC332_26068 [Capsicum chinense]